MIADLRFDGNCRAIDIENGLRFECHPSEIRQFYDNEPMEDRVEFYANGDVLSIVGRSGYFFGCTGEIALRDGHHRMYRELINTLGNGFPTSEPFPRFILGYADYRRAIKRKLASEVDHPARDPNQVNTLIHAKLSDIHEGTMVLIARQEETFALIERQAAMQDTILALLEKLTRSKAKSR